MKALWVHHGVVVQKTHDLRFLLKTLSDLRGDIMEEHIEFALKLNGYSVIVRYPGTSSTPTLAEVAEAIEAAAFFQIYAKRTVEI